MSDRIRLLRSAPPGGSKPIRWGLEASAESDGQAALDSAVRQILIALAGARKLTVVVNDPQRDTQTSAVLVRLAGGLSAVRCRALVATGTHRCDQAGREALQAELLTALPFDRIAWHDCRCEELTEVGAAGSWRCHPWLLETDWALLAIGSSEPHYFAGITGAHKTVTIGCAGFADVEANHACALSPQSRPGRLVGNPVHDGIAQMVRSLQARRPVLAVNLLQVGRTIVAAAAGEPLDALRRIAVSVRSTCFCRIPSPADALVLEVTGALARSFYQADKGIKNNEWAVRDGGALVLEAACPDGIGQDEFVSLLRTCTDFASAERAVKHRGYRLGDHKAVKLRYLTDCRGVRVFVVSAGLTAADARLLGFEKAATVEAALAAAGVDPTRHAVYRVADAANTCATVRQRRRL